MRCATWIKISAKDFLRLYIIYFHNRPMFSTTIWRCLACGISLSCHAKRGAMGARRWEKAVDFTRYWSLPDFVINVCTTPKIILLSSTFRLVLPVVMYVFHLTPRRSNRKTLCFLKGQNNSEWHCKHPLLVVNIFHFSCLYNFSCIAGFK
jgi:hypothetical protein